jgi:uncharacterized protein YjbI with pentapeptide repeats
MDLIRRLRSADLEEAQAALTEAREGGYLSDGTLRVDLTGIRLPGGDFSGADLARARLTMADLSRADLTGASLHYAVCDMVTLTGADLSGADLRRADFSIADLTGALISDAQFSRAGKLWRATMPDGSPYDGRYNLDGDLREVVELKTVNIDHPATMAEHYGVSLDAYLAGQEWAEVHLAALKEKNRK